ncbi:MAG: SEC-C metal-binding domain-containing protein [Candidatus Omnitrophota bacterium]
MSDKPGRNSPCPCGSGKKFKKCCGFNLTAAGEELFAPMPDDLKTGTKLDFYFDIFQGVMFYAEMLKTSPEFGGQLRKLCHDFEERFKPGTEQGLPDSFYLNWFVLDNRFGVAQHTVIERMMDEKDFHLMQDAVKLAAIELSDSYATCYQVKEIRKEDILFEELVTGRQWIVHRIGDTCEEETRPRDIWHARFVGPQEDAYYFGQPFVFGPEAKSDFEGIVDMVINNFKEYASTRSLKFVIPRDAFKVGVILWAEYLYGSFSDAPAGLDDELESGFTAPCFSTTDGEKMRFSLVTFKIITESGLRDKLSGMRGFEYGAQRSCWIWLKKGNRRIKSWENTILGQIFIRGNELVGEVNSLERALRLKNKLSIGLGKMVVFDRIDSKDFAAMPRPPQEDLRKFEEEQRRIHSDPEVRKVLLQKQQEYYLKDWISSKIPALNNKTPLQAVKTEEGRLQLEVLINRMEGMSNVQPDYLPKMDMNFLRQKLGLPLAVRD